MHENYLKHAKKIRQYMLCPHYIIIIKKHMMKILMPQIKSN